jgi:hypothetical protein
MKIVSAFISILLLALLAACGDNGTNSSRAILTGRAHVLGESTAVPGATVSAQGRSTQTDNDGNFRLDDLTPGSTTVTITKAGFKPFAAAVDLPVGSTNFSFAIEPE